MGWEAPWKPARGRPKRTDAQRETDLLVDIREYLGGIPGVVLAWFHRPPFPGSPNILACRRGRFVAITVLAPRRRQTGDQIAWQWKIERAGGAYILARRMKTVRDYFGGGR